MLMTRCPSARAAFSSFCICEAVQHGVHPCRVFSIKCITRVSVQRHLRTSSTTRCRPRTLALGHMLGDRDAKVIPERQPVKVETKRADAARKQLCSGVFSVLRYRDCRPWAKVGSRRCDLLQLPDGARYDSAQLQHSCQSSSPAKPSR